MNFSLLFFSALMAPASFGSFTGEVKVGILHSLTGITASSETPLVDAVMLAIEQLNAAGGLLGNKIVPVLADCESNSTKFAEEAERLTNPSSDDLVSVVFGGYSSSSRKAMLPVFERNDHILFYSNQYEGQECSSNVFYMGGTPNQQSERAVAWLIRHRSKSAYLVGSEGEFSRTLNSIVKSQFEALGGQVLGEQYLDASNSNIIRIDALVSDILSRMPTGGAVLHSASVDASVLFFRELSRFRLSPEKYPVLSFTLNARDIEAIGAAYLVGHYTSSTSFTTSTHQLQLLGLHPERPIDFLAAFRARYGTTQNVSDPMEASYIAVLLWARAVVRAGTFELTVVRGSVYESKFSCGVGMEVNNHLSKFVRVLQFAPGRLLDTVYESERTLVAKPWSSWINSSRGYYCDWADQGLGAKFFRQPIVVALVHALSGPLEDREREQLEGELAAIEKLNREGGVNGSEVAFTIFNTESNDAMASAQLANIVDNCDEFAGIFGRSPSDKLYEAAVKEATLIGCVAPPLLFSPEHSFGRDCGLHVVHTGGLLNQRLLPALAYLAGRESRPLSVFVVASTPLDTSQVDALTSGVTAQGCLVVSVRMVQTKADADVCAGQVLIQLPAGGLVINVMEDSSLTMSLLVGMRNRGMPGNKSIKMLFTGIAESDFSLFGVLLSGHYIAATYMSAIRSAANLVFLDILWDIYGYDYEVSDATETGYSSIMMWAASFSNSTSTVNFLRRLWLSSLERPAGLQTLGGSNYVSIPSFLGIVNPSGASLRIISQTNNSSSSDVDWYNTELDEANCNFEAINKLCPIDHRNTQGECVKCDEGLICTGDDIFIEPGYFSFVTLSIFKCFGDPRRCIGGPPGHVCASGRVLGVIACARCFDGWTSDIDGTCVPCPRASAVNFVVVGLVVFVGISVLYFTVDTQDHAKQTQGKLLCVMVTSIGLTAAQQLAVISRFSLMWVEPLTASFKCLLVFILDLEILNVKCITGVAQPIGEFMTKLAWIASFFIALVLAHVMFITLMRIYHFRQQPHALLQCMGSVSILHFISLVSACIGPVRCILNPNGKETSVEYPSLVCWSPEHLQLVVLGGGALLVPFSVLAWVAFLVRRYPSKIRKGDAKYLRKYGFLTYRYRPEVYWFATLVLARSFLFSLASVFPGPVYQIMVVQLIMLASVLLTSVLCPYRVTHANHLDVVASAGILVILNACAYFVQAYPEIVVAKFVVAFGGSLFGCLFPVLFYGFWVQCCMKHKKPFAFFLCHHKAGGGSFARLLKMCLKEDRRIKKKVFIDSDDLTDLNMIFDYVGSQSDKLIILCTSHIYRRPWCMGEMVYGMRNHIDAVKVVFPNFVEPSSEFINQYEKHVPDVVRLADRGLSLEDVQEVLAWTLDLVSYSLPSNLNFRVMQALVKDLISGPTRRFPGIICYESSWKSTSTLFDRMPIVVDTSKMEAVASAMVLCMLLKPLTLHTPQDIPFVRPPGVLLPEKLGKLIFMCSGDVLMNEDILGCIVHAATCKSRYILVISDEAFRFPTVETLEYLRPVAELVSQNTDVVLKHVEELFKSIAVVFQPELYSSTDVVLAVKAQEVFNRLNPIRSEKTSDHFLRMTRAFTGFRSERQSSRGVGSDQGTDPNMRHHRSNSSDNSNFRGSASAVASPSPSVQSTTTNEGSAVSPVVSPRVSCGARRHIAFQPRVRVVLEEESDPSSGSPSKVVEVHTL